MPLRTRLLVKAFSATVAVSNLIMSIAAYAAPPVVVLPAGSPFASPAEHAASAGIVSGARHAPSAS